MHTSEIKSRVARFGRHAALMLLMAGVALGCRAEMSHHATVITTPDLISPKALAQRIKDAQGNPVVINFWATWCPPCVAEMPELARFYRKYSARGVTFISVSADDPADLTSGKIEAFVREHKLPFPVFVLDGADPDAIGKALGVELGNLPMTFLYDSSGKVRQKWETEITSQQLAEAVTPLLKLRTNK